MGRVVEELARALARTPRPPLPAARRPGASRPAPHPAGQPAPRRRAGRSGLALPAAAEAQAGGPVRREPLHGPLQPLPAAVPLRLRRRLAPPGGLRLQHQPAAPDAGPARGASGTGSWRRWPATCRSGRGGTRIGACFARFAEDWSESLVDRRTAVIVLSDGWDTGEAGLLSAALSRIRRRAFAVLWLNPLMGNPGFRPETAGLLAALPHVDLLAPAHNAAALRDLARSLGRAGARGREAQTLGRRRRPGAGDRAPAPRRRIPTPRARRGTCWPSPRSAPPVGRAESGVRAASRESPRAPVEEAWPTKALSLRGGAGRQSAPAAARYSVSVSTSVRTPLVVHRHVDHPPAVAGEETARARVPGQLQKLLPEGASEEDGMAAAPGVDRRRDGRGLRGLEGAAQERHGGGGDRGHVPPGRSGSRRPPGERRAPPRPGRWTCRRRSRG